MVQGKAPGETSMIVWDTHGGRQFFNVTVRASSVSMNDSLDGIRRELRTELPGQSLKVSFENGSILLRGTVKDLGSASRAVKIVSPRDWRTVWCGPSYKHQKARSFQSFAQAEPKALSAICGMTTWMAGASPAMTRRVRAREKSTSRVRPESCSSVLLRSSFSVPSAV